MSDIEGMQKNLKAIAEVVNAFKSEAVQLRVFEVLLSQLGAVVTQPVNQPSHRSRRRRAGHKTTAPKAKDAKDSGARKGKASRSSASPGAFATISDLIGTNFFKSPKTISAIISHSKQAKGLHYKANECSPPLLRLIRDAKLTRQKNKDGQYEYTQA
jgi:hypothetical protein